jgi:hypothetical protein
MASAILVRPVLPLRSAHPPRWALRARGSLRWSARGPGGRPLDKECLVRWRRSAAIARVPTSRLRARRGVPRPPLSSPVRLPRLPQPPSHPRPQRAVVGSGCTLAAQGLRLRSQANSDRVRMARCLAGTVACSPRNDRGGYTQRLPPQTGAFYHSALCSVGACTHGCVSSRSGRTRGRRGRGTATAFPVVTSDVVSRPDAPSRLPCSRLKPPSVTAREGVGCFALRARRGYALHLRTAPAPPCCIAP